jgi:hypothetical protein
MAEKNIIQKIKPFKSAKTHDWVEVSKRSRQHLDNDKVYFRVVTKGKENLYGQIFIGSDISKVLQIEKGDRVLLLMDKNYSYFIKIIKSQSSNGYKLVKHAGGNKLFFSFALPDEIKLKKSRTGEINFEIYPDNSIVIDLTELRDLK